MKKQEVEQIIREFDEEWEAEGERTKNYTAEDWKNWKKEHGSALFFALSFLEKKGMSKNDMEYWGTFIAKNSVTSGGNFKLMEKALLDNTTLFQYFSRDTELYKVLNKK